jgi:glycosyltransferase involved in cell wall biosynthesis
MRVTVAIPTFNRSAFLRQTLEGIARQDYPQDCFETLVIDNNSRDDTARVAAEFAASKPGLRYLQETKQGLDHARNRAIAEAKGDIILFGDDDILVEPDWITKMIAPFLEHPGARIGAIGGEVIPVFPDGLPEWVSEWHAPLAFRSDAGPLTDHQSPMGANLAFPRWVFNELGSFHTALDRVAGSYYSGGDSEMIRRIRAAHMEVWFVPSAAVRHQMPASRTTFSYAARHAFDSARSRVIDRAGRPDFTRYLISRLAANLAKIPVFLLLALASGMIGRFGTAKKALVRAWRSCGYVFQSVLSLDHANGSQP